MAYNIHVVTDLAANRRLVTALVFCDKVRDWVYRSFLWDVDAGQMLSVVTHESQLKAIRWHADEVEHHQFKDILPRHHQR